MTTATILAAIALAALIVYLLTGGADFGGGVWELFARGPRGNQHRDALRDAIAPIWEANHVWLILVVVVLFSCFPLAFSALMTALHLPIILMLVGIVLRGSCFAFRSYAAGAQALERKAARVFAIASVVSPFLLGVIAGAVASGSLRVNADTGVVRTNFVSEWLAPFPIALGLLTLALCAYLAAVYMTLEVKSAPLRDDFRRRALWSGIGVGALAFWAAALAYIDAPVIGRPLLTATWALPFHAVTGGVALAALWALWDRRFRLARALAALQVTLIVLGWGLAQHPHLIPPDLTIAAAAANPAVLELILWILAVGAIFLVPAFAYLYFVFKHRR